MIANGQGISSPSFWGGLSGENPAGLVQNDALNLQGTLISPDDNFDNLGGSAAALLGNGNIGGGIEYSGYGQSHINWGVALDIPQITTAFGLSAHHYTSNGSISSGYASFDLGALVELTQAVQAGLILPDFTHGLHIIGAGLKWQTIYNLDLVLDAAYQSLSTNAVIKPGVTVNVDILQLAFAYGIATDSTADVYLTRKVTAGVGLHLTQKFMLEYEYQEIGKHRVGLTLRLN
jgi:hypothetical protein